MTVVEGEGLAEFVEGAVSVRQIRLGMQPLRLDEEGFALTHPALAAPSVGEATNGIRLRFSTDATAIELEVSQILSDSIRRACANGSMALPAYDLVVAVLPRGRVATALSEGVHQIRFEGLPGRSVVCELWLPHNIAVVLHKLILDEGTASVAHDDRPKWVVHGSSITHDSLAGGPSETWPAIVARQADWHLTAFGFRGECHLDPFVTREIARLPADLITLELGINIHNSQGLRHRTLAPALHGFLQVIRDGQPNTGVIVISPIFGGERETSVTTVSPDGHDLRGDLTLEMIRGTIADAVEIRRRRGDSLLHYVDGLTLLGQRDSHVFPDGLHPDRSGVELLISRLVPQLTR